MIAAHRDENLVFSHQTTAASKQKNLQAKTPGARFPKTPLKVPLNDENGIPGLAKTVLQAKGNNENLTTAGKGGNGLSKPGKLAMVTPAQPRAARAPLGNKTTNAKARDGQLTMTGGVKSLVKEIEKTADGASSAKPSARRPTIKSRGPAQLQPSVGPGKLEVRTDKDAASGNQSEEDEIEYAPPKLPEPPYESDVFPEGLLTYEGLKPENMFRGYYQFYFNPVGDDGLTRTQRQLKQSRECAARDGDAEAQRALEQHLGHLCHDMPEADVLLRGGLSTNTDAAAGEVTASGAQANVKRGSSSRPASSTGRPLSTLASRRAASALGIPAPRPAAPAPTGQSKKSAVRVPMFPLPGRKPVTGRAVMPLARSSSAEHVPAVAASRSTLGYSKGRSAQSVVGRQQQHSRSNPSSSSASSALVGGKTTTYRPPSAASQGSSAAAAMAEANAGAGVGPAQADRRTLVRSASTVSSGSGESTITPARFVAQKKHTTVAGGLNANGDEQPQQHHMRRPEFLSIFDVEEEGGSDEDEGLGRAPLPMDDDDDDFQFS